MSLKTDAADTLMEDDPGIYQDLLDERDEAMLRLAAVERECHALRARVLMLLRCHYDEHEHRGSPTCFDVQSPADEWETEALARHKN